MPVNKKRSTNNATSHVTEVSQVSVECHARLASHLNHNEVLICRCFVLKRRGREEHRGKKQKGMGRDGWNRVEER
jgi:hypothetical protein